MSHKTFGWMLLFGIFVSPHAFADELAKIADAPVSGIDPDLKDELDDAHRKLETGDADGASKAALDLHLGTNRFYVAQKAQLVAPSVDLLRRVGKMQLSAGHLDLGLQSLDAAWTLGGRRVDSEYAHALVTSADRTWDKDQGAALYLVRRARLADPQNEDARVRDESWSTNRLAWIGWTIFATGVAAIAGGVTCAALSHQASDDLAGSIHSRAEADSLVSRQRTFGVVSGVSFGVGVAALLSAPWVILAGEPTYRPTSPALLPALPEETP